MKIDADPITVPDVSSMSGRLIASVRFKGEQVAAFDRAGSGRYEMVTDPVPDVASFRSTPVARARDRVDRFVRQGYRPFWARSISASSWSRGRRDGRDATKPVLIRVETQGSHGYRPTDKLIQERADQWAFAAAHMDVK